MTRTAVSWQRARVGGAVALATGVVLAGCATGAALDAVPQGLVVDAGATVAAEDVPDAGDAGHRGIGGASAPDSGEAGGAGGAPASSGGVSGGTPPDGAGGAVSDEGDGGAGNDAGAGSAGEGTSGGAPGNGGAQPATSGGAPGAGGAIATCSVEKCPVCVIGWFACCTPQETCDCGHLFLPSNCR